jgi:hypothetical protein
METLPQNFKKKEQKLIEKIKEAQNNIFVEGLKRKGFEFQNNEDLSEFIKSHCIRQDEFDSRLVTYFVKGVAFLNIEPFNIFANTNVIDIKYKYL